MLCVKSAATKGQLRKWQELLESLLILLFHCRYWDWTQDLGQSYVRSSSLFVDRGSWYHFAISFYSSPVFDPVTGFGGNGVSGTYTLPNDAANTSIVPYAFVGCVQDGPFSSYTIHLGPGKSITDHCLVRGINSTYSQYFTPSAMANATSLTTFEEFRIELEGMPFTPTHKMHDSIHFGVGGEMSSFYSSPGG